MLKSVKKLATLLFIINIALYSNTVLSNAYLDDIETLETIPKSYIDIANGDTDIGTWYFRVIKKRHGDIYLKGSVYLNKNVYYLGRYGGDETYNGKFRGFGANLTDSPKVHVNGKTYEAGYDRTSEESRRITLYAPMQEEMAGKKLQGLYEGKISSVSGETWWFSGVYRGEYDNAGEIRTHDVGYGPRMRMDKDWTIPASIWNSAPTLTVSKPLNNSSYGGNVEVSVNVQDSDIGDTIKIYYRVGGSSGQAGTLLTSVTSNGSSQIVTREISGSKFSQGSNKLYIWAQDSGGSKTSEVLRNLSIDNSPPEIVFNSNGNSTPKKSHESTVTVSDNNGVSVIEYQWTSSNSFPTSGNWNSFSSGDTIKLNEGNGNYYLHIRAIDNFGNKSEITSNKFVIDNLKPNTPDISTPTDWVNSNVTVNISDGYDLGGVERTEYRLEGATIKDWTVYSSPFGISNEGETVIKARTVDIAGNISAISTKVVKIDKTDPVVNIEDSLNEWMNNNINVKVNYSDSGGSNIGIKRYAITKNSDKPNSWTNLDGITDDEITLTNEGEWFLHVQVIDNAGNEEYRYKGPFKVDKTKPLIEINEPSGDWKKEDIVVGVSYEDSLSNIKNKEYLITQDINRPTTWNNLTGVSSQNLTVTKEGLNYIHIRIVDNAGNESYAYKGPFKLDKTPADLEILTDIDKWVPAPLKLKLKVVDSDRNSPNISEARGIRRVGENWTYNDTLEVNINSNGVYNYEILDNAGNIKLVPINITKIDDIPPEIFELKVGSVTNSEVDLELVNTKDLQSGLNDTPFSFSKDGGTTWTSWNSDNRYKFKDLDLNKIYNFRARVRDKALNIRMSSSLPVSTLTEDIELKYVKSEGSNKADLIIDLKGNPSDTETMITRQNMITNEVVTVKDWSTTKTYSDRVNTFVVGYRYTAYARNKDGVVGNGDSVVIKDVETPTIEVKGFGDDKYIFDKENQNLYLFGNTSNHIEIKVKTLATEKLIYEIKDEINSINKNENLYGRYGEYEYRFNTKINKLNKQVLELKLKAEYENMETGDIDIKDLKIDNPKITVYQIPSLSKLLNFSVSQSGDDISVGYTDKTSYENSVYQEVNNKQVIKDLLKDLSVSTDGASKLLQKNTTVKLNPGDLTVEKSMGGGNYRETFKQNSVIITTNISSFITQLEENWSLEVYVVTPKGGYTLPRDLERFRSDGYNIDIRFAKDKTSALGNSEAEKYDDISSSGTSWNITSSILNNPTLGMFGIKVTDVLPTYHTASLNLQDSETATNTTLEAIGNSNIKYDKTFIFNRMNNKMVAHNENIFKDGNWVGTLYYRVDSATNLLMVTSSKVKVISPSTLETIKQVNQTNTGSEVFGDNLYIGTSSGLKTVNASGNLSTTSFNKPVVSLTTQGSDLLVASTDGLYVLDRNLEQKQFMSNNDIFGTNSQIKTLHTSNGSIYVSKNLKGNEYVVIGK